MEEVSFSTRERLISPSIVSSSVPEPNISRLEGFFQEAGVSFNLPEGSRKKDAHSDLFRGVLKVERIELSRVTCGLTVKPQVANCFGMLHGGAVAAVAELVSLACLRTVVAEDKEVFLGELSISYFSAAVQNMEVEVDGCILMRGRSIIVTAIEFRVKKTRQLVYTARATFYNMPLANL